MVKKMVSALFGLVFALALIVPPKADAAVVVGVGLAPGYGYVVARPRPYVYVAPAPYVAYGPAYTHRPYFYGRGYRYAGPRGYGWRR
jgi:hypothetical protein